jgi:hypothetical protein
MKHTKNIDNIIHNIIRITYSAIICVALIANMLGAREKSIIIVVVAAMMWACTRILVEGATAVSDFMMHARPGIADVDGLYAILKKNMGDKTLCQVSWHDGVPIGVYHVVFVSDEHINTGNIPFKHNGNPVVVFKCEQQKSEPS